MMIRKLTECFDGSVAYNNDGSSEFRNRFGGLNKLSNLLSTKQSTKMTDKDKDDCLILP